MANEFMKPFKRFVIMKNYVCRISGIGKTTWQSYKTNMVYYFISGSM